MEIFTLIVHVKFFQNDMAHCHRHGGIRALFRRYPGIRELGHFTVIRRYRNGLGSLVANLGEKVCIRCACLWHI